jgi:hypothetical protein
LRKAGPKTFNRGTRYELYRTHVKIKKIQDVNLLRASACKFLYLCVLRASV